MIANYSDPIVTLTQVYKASEAGSVPTLGACVIGPHYIVRKYEDLGGELQLNSSDNYAASYGNSYSYDSGLAARPYPARETKDGAIDTNSVKVLVKNAELLFKEEADTDSNSVEVVEGNELKIAKNGTYYKFKDPYAQDSEVKVLPGDSVKISFVADSDSFSATCEVINFLKDSNGNYTRCVLSKTFPGEAAISSVKFFRIADCYVAEGSISKTASTIAINNNAVSAEIDLGNGIPTAFPIYSGAFYAEYRSYSNKYSDKYGQVASIDNVEALLGKICPENPLGIAVANAVEESEGNFVYFVSLQEDANDEEELVAAYQNALDLIADKDGIYGLVPCTDNKAVIKALLQFVEKQSAEDIPYFKYLYASKELQEEEKVLPTDKVALTISSVTLGSDSGSVVTNIVFSGTPLLSIGTLRAGDKVKWSDKEASIVSTDFKNTVIVAGNQTGAGNITTSTQVSIYKQFKNSAQMVEALIDWKDISNKRCSICFADGAVYNSTMLVPNYCVAAALAGKRSGAYPHAPLSNVAMKALTTTEEHGITASQSKELGAAGFWRVGMNEDGVCISRRQLTSVASGDVNYDEQSIVCNIDSIGLSLKVIGRDLVGNTNISPLLLNILNAELNAALDEFKLYVNDLIGPQLLTGAVLSIKQDPVYKDRIYAELDGEPPKPFNRFHMTFYMR